MDTGSETTVLKPSMIPLELLQNDCAKSTVNLQGAFGKAVPALLINIPATLVTGKPQHAVLLTCAVTDFLNQDVALVSLADYENLQESSIDFVLVKSVRSGTPFMLQSGGGENQNAIVFETKIVNREDKKNEKMGDIFQPTLFNSERSVLQEFKEMQATDPSLKSCWNFVSKEKSDFFVNQTNGLLYCNQISEVLKLIV